MTEKPKVYRCKRCGSETILLPKEPRSCFVCGRLLSLEDEVPAAPAPEIDEHERRTNYGAF